MVTKEVFSPKLSHIWTKYYDHFSTFAGTLSPVKQFVFYMDMPKSLYFRNCNLLWLDVGPGVVVRQGGRGLRHHLVVALRLHLLPRLAFAPVLLLGHI